MTQNERRPPRTASRASRATTARSLRDARKRRNDDERRTDEVRSRARDGLERFDIFPRSRARDIGGGTPMGDVARGVG